jgi:hypothetical protein
VIAASSAADALNYYNAKLIREVPANDGRVGGGWAEATLVVIRRQVWDRACDAEPTMRRHDRGAFRREVAEGGTRSSADSRQLCVRMSERDVGATSTKR